MPRPQNAGYVRARIAEIHPVGDLASLTRTRLHTDYRQVCRGFWVDATTSKTVLTVAIAHHLAVPGSVISGWAAAHLYGYTLPDDAFAELCVGGGSRRRKGIVLRRITLPSQAVTDMHSLAVTTPTWTVFNLARFLPFLDAVVALERFAQQGFDLQGFTRGLDRAGGLWGVNRVRRAAASADPDSESYKETELRLILDGAEITGFVSQYVVPGLGYRLDFADPWSKVGIEYDGIHHLTPEQQRKDQARRNRLQRQGWVIFVVTHAQLRDPRLRAELVEQIGHAQLRRARAE